MSTVHVRIGDHRTKYHTDTDCPSLNGKQDTYMATSGTVRAEFHRRTYDQLVVDS